MDQAPPTKIRMSRLMPIVMLTAMLALAGPAFAQEDPPAATPQTAAAEPAKDTSNTAKISTVYRNGYSVTVTGRAQTNGTFTMAFKVSQEDPVTFTVNVVQGMKAKQIAKDITKELTIAAGERFKVKQGGTKVTVKKRNKKMPPLAVQITEQKLTGVALLISGL